VSGTADETPPAATHTRPDLATEFAEPGTPTEQNVAAIAGELLGIDAVGARDNFFDLGFDSLLAHRLVTRLAQQHGLSLPVGAVFEHPTVQDLARFADLQAWAADMLDDD
jgi:acyl carrier protein